jgi:hypothetical protein
VLERIVSGQTKVNALNELLPGSGRRRSQNLRKPHEPAADGRSINWQATYGF